MSHGWLELESDPGLFTLLLEDFGVQGIQVEEIYDLQKSLEGPVYGFIFLFKWIEERRSRRKIIQEEESFVVDEKIVNSMFFAQQIIANSCATHALLSVLLNCDNCKLKLGDTLNQLKEFTSDMNPEAKGFAIGNMPELARAHNSHARPEPRRLPEKQQGISAVRTREAFHFVSYVPINGRLFELDGLKPYPIDHGPWAENEDWTEKFRRVISERLGMATGGEPYHDIRFNLMAVVPDRRQQYDYKLNTLKTNRQIVLEALQQMVKVTTPEIEASPSKYLKKDPIVTRSVAAREAAAANHGLSATTSANLPEPTIRTRQQKAAAAAATSTSSGSSSRSTTPPPSNPRLPPALDGHNYAKSPVTVEYSNLEDEGMGLDSDVEVVDDTVSALAKQTADKMGLGQIRGDQLTTVKENAVKIEITVSDENEGSVSMPTTVATTDVTKPLSINTKFTSSPGPSSESTDTASEVGSAMHSPASSSRTVSAQSSPNFGYIDHRHLTAQGVEASQLLLERLESKGVHLEPKSDLEMGMHNSLKPSMAEVKNELMKLEPSLLEGVNVGDGRRDSDGKGGSPRGGRSKFSSQQGFTPKDLLALLKNVESEIASCESLLRDEIEKRKRYKMDDCRRTHNYDQFICTFLSMLAEQGHLATLVEQHMLTRKRQGINIGHLQKKMPKPDRRRRSRGKKKR